MSASPKALGLGIAWAGNFHDLRAWAELLVATRAATPGLTYPIPGFGNEVVNRGRALQRLWSEVLRYHRNVAYLYEVDQVREATEWLLVNSTSL